MIQITMRTKRKKNVFNTQTLNGHLFGLVFFTNIRPRFELVLNLINQEKEDCNAGHTLNSMIIIIIMKMIIYLIISFWMSVQIGYSLLDWNAGGSQSSCCCFHSMVNRLNCIHLKSKSNTHWHTYNLVIKSTHRPKLIMMIINCSMKGCLEALLFISFFFCLMIELDCEEEKQRKNTYPLRYYYRLIVVN